VSPEQAKLLNLALNRISGEWDEEIGGGYIGRRCSGIGFLFGDRVEFVPVKLYEVRWKGVIRSDVAGPKEDRRCRS